MSGSGGDPGAFTVGAWRVEPRRLRVVRDGREARVERRVMDLLCCLAARPGRTWTREELLDRVWGGAAVGDEALSSAVSRLRRALDPPPSEPSPIETLPRVGYRLRAPVARLESSAEERPAEVRRRSKALPVVGAAAVVVAVAAAALDPPAPHVAPAAGRVFPLTAEPGVEVQPALAPGGAGWVAWAARAPESPSFDLFVGSVDGAGRRRLTSGPGDDQHPAWSPDATRLAFARFEAGRCAILEVAVLGGPERPVAECQADETFDLDWSPDGRSLVFPDRPSSGEPWRLVAVDVLSGARRELTRPPAGSVGDHAAAWSPDGALLALVRSPVLGVDELHLLSPGSGRTRLLTRDGAKIHGLDFAGDGRALVVASNRGGLFGLWRMPLDGGPPERLAAGSGRVDAPSVAPGRIAVVEWHDEAGLVSLDLAGEREPRRVAASTRYDWHPRLSPDGRSVAFVSDRSGSPELWIAPLAGGEPRRLTRFGGPLVGAPDFDPAGRFVVFEVRDEAGARVFRVDAGGGGLQAVAGPHAEAPSVSADGTAVYYASPDGGGWRVWRRPLAGGVPEPVVAARRARESPDGRWLYFARPRSSGLHRRALGTPGGAVETVAAGLAPLDHDNWDVTADAVYWTRRPRPERPELVRVSLASRRSETLGPLPGLLGHSGLTVSRDGRTVLVARVFRMESDVLLAEAALPEN